MGWNNRGILPYIGFFLVCLCGCAYTTSFGHGSQSDGVHADSDFDKMVEYKAAQANLPENYGFKKEGFGWTPPPDPDTSSADVLPYSTPVREE